MKEPKFPVTVFYDGACIVCSTEIEHYREKDSHDRLILVDISRVDFDPDHYGKTRDDLMGRLHVLDRDGVFYMGLDAFPVIWQALPGRIYRVLSFLVTLPGLHSLFQVVYQLFARYRKYLPKRKHSCKSERCSLRN